MYYSQPTKKRRKGHQTRKHILYSVFWLRILRIGSLQILHVSMRMHIATRYAFKIWLFFHYGKSNNHDKNQKLAFFLFLKHLPLCNFDWNAFSKMLTVNMKASVHVHCSYVYCFFSFLFVFLRFVHFKCMPFI